jgi:hypothetical protein
MHTEFQWGMLLGRSSMKLADRKEVMYWIKVAQDYIQL